METVVVKTFDYWQEDLPDNKRTHHYEVRRNFGYPSSPHWQTIKYADTEEEANEWLKDN